MHGSTGVFLPGGATERFFFIFWPLNHNVELENRHSAQHQLMNVFKVIAYISSLCCYVYVT